MTKPDVEALARHPIFLAFAGAVMGAFAAVAVMTVGISGDLREIRAKLEIVTVTHTKAIERLERTVFHARAEQP